MFLITPDSLSPNCTWGQGPRNTAQAPRMFGFKWLVLFKVWIRKVNDMARGTGFIFLELTASSP